MGRQTGEGEGIGAAADSALSNLVAALAKLSEADRATLWAMLDGVKG
jgi:hypothetical protein